MGGEPDRDKQTSQAADGQETRCIPFDEFAANVAALFDEAASGKKVTIERDGMRFRLTAVRRRPRRKHHFSMDDALWDIVGIVNSGGPGDVATNKHKYLADAYADLHEQSTAASSSPPSKELAETSAEDRS